MRYSKGVTTKKPADAPAEAGPTPPASTDVAIVHGVTPDGGGLQVLRARDNRLELGAIRPLREGAPISGEVVRLRPRQNQPLVCDVDVEYKAPDASADRQLAESVPRTGPAQVASDDYRRNWDAIWSREPGNKTGLAN